MKTIIKRDGRVAAFDPLKIRDAILKAMAETDAGEDIALATMIAGQIAQIDGQMGVEEIQDLVEDKLMSSNRKDAARKYIIYRNERTKIRERDSDLMRKIKEKVTASSVENANANVDERSFGGRKAEAAAIIQKEIALDELMSPDIAEAHRDGLTYQHDLDSYSIGMHNCLFCDIERLFTNGFITRNGDVRPPNSLSTACQQLAVILQAQSQVQYGGVAALHIDSDLVPFVKKSFIKYYLDGMKYLEHCTQGDIDTFSNWFQQNEFSISDPWLNDDRPAVYAYAMDLLEREGRQSTQALYHNLNTLESRAGSQVPFSSIDLGRDTSSEGRLVTKWLLEASIDGIGKNHLTSIFPISIMCYKKGVNADPGDPNYDLKRLAIKSLAKRIYPNFANGDWSEAHEDPNVPDTIFGTMGQLLRLM